MMKEYRSKKKIRVMTYADFVDFFKKVPHETPYYAETFGKYVFERFNNFGDVFFRVVLSAYYIQEGQVYLEDLETKTVDVVGDNYLNKYEEVEE